MKEVRFLSKGEVEELRRLLIRTHGTDGGLFDGNLVAIGGGAKRRIWIAPKDVLKLDLKRLRVVSVGLYVGRIDRGKLKLSIEGAQLVGPRASRNVVVVSREAMERYLRGHDVEAEEAIECEDGQYVILKSGDDYAGSGKFRAGKVINNLPKARLIQS